MKKNIFFVKKCAACLFLCSLLASCGENGAVSTLKEDKIFSLDYGTFEDELNVFNLNQANQINTSVAMRDGFFFIANGEAKKIMEMNSYGDLLSLYYNEEANPRPSFSNSADVVSTTRKATAYPFNEISSIAVDSQKRLYVVDKFPVERQELDEKDDSVLSQIVLRFNEDGSFADYLGQQGPGGTPFPLIKSIYVTDSNELVVVCIKKSGCEVFWFNADGYLLFKVPLSRENIPDPHSGKAVERFVTLENVIPSYDGRILYLKADYSSSHMEGKISSLAGIDYDESLLFALDVETGKYSEPIIIPPYRESTVEGFGSEVHNIPYDFIGITDNDWMFFMVANEGGYDIQMVQASGSRVLRRHLAMDRKKILYTAFNLSNTGILSSLNILGDKAQMSWWRTDSLIQAVIKN
ncbi:MAG: hypothetical protein IKN90_02500 [Treponema sp.]|nr:hypothetical protein [Treponema sp.]